MILSIITGFKTETHFSTKLHRNWLIITSLAILLFSGNIFYLFITLFKVRYSHELVTGTSLLVISCLVYFASRHTKTLEQYLQQEMTGRKQAELKLRKLSLTDQLTGLYNRKGFFTLVQNHLKIAKRQKKSVILLYADIDNLKKINDTFGRQEGDLMLLGTANVFKTTFRESDIIARIGSDEFVAFFIGETEKNIENVIDRLQHSIVVHNARENQKYELSIEIVTAYYNWELYNSVDDMLAEANKLMYEKKNNKKEHFVAETSAVGPFADSRQNFILFVNNLIDDTNSFDIKIYIDGRTVVDEECFIGTRHAFSPYQFHLSKTMHTLKVESKKGKAMLEKEFEIRDNHVAVIEYTNNPQGKKNPAASNQFTFNIQDV